MDFLYYLCDMETTNKTMNKLEQLHLQAIESEVYVDTKPYDVHFVADTDKAAIKSAEITQQIAVEFWVWMRENDTPENAEMYTNFTDKDMFQEFLKTKQ